MRGWGNGKRAVMADETPTPEGDPGEQDTPVSDPATPPGDIPPEVKAALRKANKEAETLRLKLKEIEDRDKSEEQRRAEALAAAQESASKATLELTRYRVAAAKGLDAADAEWLTGSSEEDVTASADRFLARVGAAKSARPSFDGGSRRTSEAPADMNALIRDTASRRR